MKPSQVKAELFERNLTVSKMARDKRDDYDPSVTFNSFRVMLGDTLFGRRYLPAIADFINEQWGIKITRAKHLEPTRSVRKTAA